jgi:hypothetical protein
VIGTRLEQLNLAIKSNAGEAERSLVQLATNTTNSIRDRPGCRAQPVRDVDRGEQRAQAERIGG